MVSDRPPDWRARAWDRARRALAGQPGRPFMTRGAAYSVVVLVFLVFLAAGGSYWLSATAVNKAVATRASVTQLCRAGNEARAQQIVLWTHLVVIAKPPPGQTPAQARARARMIAQFLGFVHQVFAPRNCTRIPGGE